MKDLYVRKDTSNYIINDFALSTGQSHVGHHVRRVWAQITSNRRPSYITVVVGPCVLVKRPRGKNFFEGVVVTSGDVIPISSIGTREGLTREINILHVFLRIVVDTLLNTHYLKMRVVIVMHNSSLPLIRICTGR